MTAYIKQLIDEFDAQKIEGQFVMQSHIAAIAEELDRLDPRDFDPSVRAGIVQARANLTYFGTVKSGTGFVTKGILEKVRPMLDQYRGEGSGGIRRSFAYIADADLRTIIERDYIELRNKLYPDESWKSTVIMAGSILEAVLFDRLGESNWKAKAMTSPTAPQKAGQVLPMDEWKLVSLINVAVNIGRLPKVHADTIHQVLRDYRNFVHPKKEIKATHECGEPQAMSALGALDTVCDHFEKNP